MKIISNLLMVLTTFLLTACFAGTAPDSELKTLRIVRIENGNAWFVPTRAVISGPGNATAPLQLQTGKDRLVQGMITLSEDPDELQELTNRIKKQYGPEMALKKELTANVLMAVSIDGQKLWEHQIFSGNQGMPFQVMVPADASASLKLQMHFSPTGADGSSRSSVVSQSFSKTSSTANGQTSVSQQQTTGFSAAGSTGTADFTVEQTFDF